MDTFKFQTRWEELMAAVYLNISMAFDTESQTPILEKLRRYGLDKWSLWWVGS